VLLYLKKSLYLRFPLNDFPDVVAYRFVKLFGPIQLGKYSRRARAF